MVKRLDIIHVLPQLSVNCHKPSCAKPRFNVSVGFLTHSSTYAGFVNLMTSQNAQVDNISASGTISRKKLAVATYLKIKRTERYN